MKKVLVLMLLVVLAGGSVFAAERPEAEERISVISMGFMHEFWQAVKAGTEKAADELGIVTTFEGPATEDMVDVQINMMENAIRTRPAGILLAPLDAEALVPYIERAVDEGIKVGLFDAGAETDAHVTLVATDNLAAGGLAGERMIEEIGTEGKVGVVVHSATDRSAISRRDGFLNYIEDNSDIEILEPVYGGGDHQESANLVVDMVRANPDLDGIYATNEGSAVGAGIGLRESGKAGEILLIGFDSGAQQIEMLREGTILGFVSQDPVNIGYLGVKTLYEAIQGEDVPEVIDTGAVFVDETNIDDPDVQQIIYQ